MKKRLVTILLVLGLFSITLGVTFTFFNYTRTGSANTIAVGRIYFTSSQEGTINLTNVFPVKSTELSSDVGNSSEVIITVRGDTSYPNGVEYLLTFDDTNVYVNNKQIPIGVVVTPEKTGELGNSDEEYFTNRGGATSLYKTFIEANDTVDDGKYVMVGYIRPGVAEVNGTIGIKAFIDADRIAISDTYDGTESDYNGTTVSWVNRRTVLTRDEWNSLQTNGLSFKVKVEANEGIWVEEPTNRNDLGTINIDHNQATEINFIHMSEEMIDTHSDVVDITATGGQGVVKAWYEGTTLYIASPGETYFPQTSTGLLAGFSNVTTIHFNNVNTSEVTLMNYMFSGDRNLISLDLSGLGGDNLNSIENMFAECTNLEKINMNNFNFGNITSFSEMFINFRYLKEVTFDNVDTSNIINMSSMFAECVSLERIDLSSFDMENVESLLYMFRGCTNLETIILGELDFSSVTSMQAMFRNTAIKTLDLSKITFNTNINMMYLFQGCSQLRTIYVSSDLVNYADISQENSMFDGCTSLVGGSGTTYNSLSDGSKGKYAIIDGGSSNPGLLTYKAS